VTAGKVWCPACQVDADLDGVQARPEFKAHQTTIDPDGTLDLGMRDDVFLDFWHLPCGTKVRFGSNATWDGEQYGPDPRPFVEVDRATDVGLVPGVFEGTFMGYIDDLPAEYHQHFKDTLETLLAMYDASRAAVTERHGDSG
jgi:hypothetical protein